MGGTSWMNEEIVIIVFYASRNVYHQACSEVLSLKTNIKREVTAIRDKLKQIRKQNPHLYDSTTNKWNISAVDEWLWKQEVQNLESLVTLWTEEAQIVQKVKSLQS